MTLLKKILCACCRFEEDHTVFLVQDGGVLGKNTSMFSVKTIFSQGVYLLKVFMSALQICMCCDRKAVLFYEKGRDIMMH